MEFPGIMLVDYVRVYQRTDATNIGCDPPDYPTSQYIKDHMVAYTSEFHIRISLPIGILNPCDRS